MKRMFSVRIEDDLIAKVRETVKKNRPRYANITHFVEIALTDLVNKIKHNNNGR